ncbi:hypothetical protein HIDPHFAB_03271 [Nocardioides sp. T2.26MG-1]|nr:hypothetical protein HIDPHFAB_03271 [Nocardioides sp. T2.26MG-1]
MDETAATSAPTPATDITPDRPVLRVVRGDATPEEVAALVTVFAALRAPEPPARRQAPAWAAPYRKVRRTLPHGPGGWRASALPR